MTPLIMFDTLGAELPSPVGGAEFPPSAAEQERVDQVLVLAGVPIDELKDMTWPERSARAFELLLGQRVEDSSRVDSDSFAAPFVPPLPARQVLLHAAPTALEFSNVSGQAGVERLPFPAAEDLYEAGGNLLKTVDSPLPNSLEILVTEQPSTPAEQLMAGADAQLGIGLPTSEFSPPDWQTLQIEDPPTIVEYEIGASSVSVETITTPVALLRSFELSMREKVPLQPSALEIDNVTAPRTRDRGALVTPAIPESMSTMAKPTIVVPRAIAELPSVEPVVEPAATDDFTESKAVTPMLPRHQGLLANGPLPTPVSLTTGEPNNTKIKAPPAVVDHGGINANPALSKAKLERLEPVVAEAQSAQTEDLDKIAPYSTKAPEREDSNPKIPLQSSRGGLSVAELMEPPPEPIEPGERALDWLTQSRQFNDRLRDSGASKASGSGQAELPAMSSVTQPTTMPVGLSTTTMIEPVIRGAVASAALPAVLPNRVNDLQLAVNSALKTMEMRFPGRVEVNLVLKDGQKIELMVQAQQQRLDIELRGALPQGSTQAAWLDGLDGLIKTVDGLGYQLQSLRLNGEAIHSVSSSQSSGLDLAGQQQRDRGQDPASHQAELSSVAREAATKELIADPIAHALALQSENEGPIPNKGGVSLYV